MPAFYQYSLKSAPNTLLTIALRTTVPALTAQFPNRAVLVHQVMPADIERQKRKQVELYA